jgi:hypothetical protein
MQRKVLKDEDNNRIKFHYKKRFQLAYKAAEEL